ncbi:MAG: hypothetical protein HY746_02830 [Elusimicrobia bacterium]|nr:hypothetical protein [Elusimicrobiota bacterium]
MFSAIKLFFAKWFLRFKIFSLLFATWAVIYSTVTLLGFKIGFEYDDCLVFSAPAFQKTMKEKIIEDAPGYWDSVNGSYKLERIKPLPYLALCLARFFGFETCVLCFRNEAGSENMVKYWKPLIKVFYFTTDENERYKTMEKDSYLVYFASSDTDVIQARKAEIVPVRVRRSVKSLNKLEHNPGKFKEFILPLSEF